MPQAPATLRTELARQAVKQWSDAVDRHDVDALTGLYADHVMFYGREASRSQVLAAKRGAFGRGSTFRQSIVGDVAAEEIADGVTATFTKRSGRAGKTTDVRAKLVLGFAGGAPRIVTESDEATDRNRGKARLGKCEEVAEKVVTSLPEVAREIAEADKAAAATGGSARPGGVGPVEEGDGSFSVGIGVHTDERFEGIIWYRVDARGQLTVSTMTESDLPLPRASIEEVERACGGGCERQLPSAAAVQQVSFEDIARAAVPTFQTATGRASLGDGGVEDCRGDVASTDGVEAFAFPDASAGNQAGSVHELGRALLPGGEMAAWLGTGATDPGVEQAALGFLTVVHLDGRRLVIDAVGPWSGDIAGRHSIEEHHMGAETVYVEPVRLGGTGAQDREDGLQVWHETNGRLVNAGVLLTSASFDGTIAPEGDCGWDGSFDAAITYGTDLTLRGKVTWDQVDVHHKPCEASPGHREKLVTRVAHWKDGKLVAREALDDNPLGDGPPSGDGG